MKCIKNTAQPHRSAFVQRLFALVSLLVTSLFSCRTSSQDQLQKKKKNTSRRSRSSISSNSNSNSEVNMQLATWCRNMEYSHCRYMRSWKRKWRLIDWWSNKLWSISPTPLPLHPPQYTSFKGPASITSRTSLVFISQAKPSQAKSCPAQ